jgi:secreted trypsin-like serine protease
MKPTANRNGMKSKSVSSPLLTTQKQSASSSVNHIEYLHTHVLTLLSAARDSGKLAKSGVINKQIIGGENATLGQFPWQVVMTIDDAWMCGGSLILSNWVLTAAHCAG